MEKEKKALKQSLTQEISLDQESFFMAKERREMIKLTQEGNKHKQE